MKKLRTAIVALSLGSILASSGMSAFAGEGKNTGSKPIEGIVVEDIVMLEQLPEEAQNGSIKVGDVQEQAMTNLAKLSAIEAIQVASKASPGKVVELQLDEENGFLIWEVTKMTPDGKELQLKLDAGNGRLLAAETEGHKEGDEREDGKHSKWKF